MKHHRRLAFAACLALVCANASALTVITNSTTITNAVNDSVYIGSGTGSSLTNPVVTLASGGHIQGNVDVYEGILQLAGGSISGNFVKIYNVLSMSSGTLGQSLTITRNEGRLDMTGGTIQGLLQNVDAGTISLRGGTCFSLEVQSGSVTVGTEIVSSIVAIGGRTELIRGGYSPQYYAEGDSELHIRGGLRSSDIHLYSGNAKIFIYGSNLTSTFVATNVANFFTTSTVYRLTGILQDGTVLTNVPYYIEKGSQSQVFLVQTNVVFPALTIASNDTDAIRLAWPHPSFGYMAQVSTNFGDLPGATWSDVTGSPVRVSTTRFLALTSTTERATYRLISR